MANQGSCGAQGSPSASSPPVVIPEGPYYSMDVECVASGMRHCDRVVAKVSVVDEQENILLEQYVAPSVPVFSHLTPLTGITANDLVDAPPFEQVQQQVRAIVRDACLVGQGILHDIAWLGLERGRDYRDHFDLVQLFRFRKAPGSPGYPFIVFSLRHTVKWLMDTDIQAHHHDPTMDALYSMKLFKKYRGSTSGYLTAVRQTLRRAPRTPSAAALFPTLDGVAMSRPREGCPNCAAPPIPDGFD